MTQPFPMLASPADLTKLQYPVMGFPKIDGIRAVIHNGQALSRKLIALPNHHIQKLFASGAYDGLDGELVVGSPTDPLCIKHSTSGVMSQGGEPDFTFIVFDHWCSPDRYEVRLSTAALKSVLVTGALKQPRIQVVPHTIIANEKQLLAYEAKQLELGYEGIILRSPTAPYKHGRSTVREGGMLKLKRFVDSEALITSVVEEQANGNAAETDNLGRTKRSSAKAGKSGKGRAGTLVGHDIRHGWTVEIGTGLSAAERDEWWVWAQADGPKRQPRIAKYKYFPIGMQDRPRHPVFISLRDPRDL